MGEAPVIVQPLHLQRKEFCQNFHRVAARELWRGAADTDSEVMSERETAEIKVWAASQSQQGDLCDRKGTEMKPLHLSSPSCFPSEHCFLPDIKEHSDHNILFYFLIPTHSLR
jgi:hypothetical protein